MLSLDVARALLCRLMALALVPAPPAWLGVGEAWTLPPPGVVVVAVVVAGIPGAVAMRLAVVWLRRDEFRRKLNLDMRGDDDETVPSP